MIEIGRICIKIAGRDAGKKCVVVETLGKHIVLIDGETRRRKCNMTHLEPLAQKVAIEKGASHSQVALAFKNMGITLTEKKPKTAAPTQKKPTPKKLA